MRTKAFIEDKNFKGLYYHSACDATILSFLSDNDKVNKYADIAVIGRIPEIKDDETVVTPQNFVENKKFTEFLHQVIAENVDSDAQLQALAKYNQNG
jgi:hypothetical protein